MKHLTLANVFCIAKANKEFVDFKTGVAAELSSIPTTAVCTKDYILIEKPKKPSNIAYKWRKIFAAINHNKGRIELTPVEAQELIDDIEKL